MKGAILGDRAWSPGPNEAEDEQSDSSELSAGVSQFVEGIGMLMEKYGLPRIGGRIMGLLMLDNKPLSLDDISKLLGVSRASVSTNLRMSEISGLAVRVAKPGDRRDYYIGAENMWLRAMEANNRDVLLMLEVARKAMPNIPKEEIVARTRLQELIDFYEFFKERLDQITEEWQAYKVKMYGQGNS